MTEVWQPIAGYADYEVSNLGRVRSYRQLRLYAKRTEPMLLARRPHKNGYFSVCLYTDAGRKAWYVHQLVATAFVGPCPAGMEVNHKDLNKGNCAATNLEYMTHGDNHRHAVRNGRIDVRKARVARGSTLGRELRPSEVRRIRRRRLAGESPTKLAAAFGIRPRHVSNICARRIWKHVQ